jgi:hypothetical protein
LLSFAVILGHSPGKRLRQHGDAPGNPAHDENTWRGSFSTFDNVRLRLYFFEYEYSAIDGDVISATEVLSHVN